MLGTLLIEGDSDGELEGTNDGWESVEKLRMSFDLGKCAQTTSVWETATDLLGWAFRWHKGGLS